MGERPGGRCRLLGILLAASMAGGCGSVPAGNGAPDANAGACAADGDCLTRGGTAACCGGVCLDIGSDSANCGRCGRACPKVANSTITCAAGACGVVSCAPGFGDCDHLPGNGCEASLSTDAANCGACGTRCSSPPNTGAVCAGGTCGVGGCIGSFQDCDHNAANGCETEVQADAGNCGGCGRVCPAMTPNATPTCAQGACGLHCDGGFGDCNLVPADGCEAVLATDVKHCGACQTACAVPHAVAGCAAGACAVAACDAGFGDCNRNPADGCEAVLATDVKHCGACGNGCAPGLACVAGQCTCQPCALANVANGGMCVNLACVIGQCVAGFADCDKMAGDGCEASLANDPANCGACGVKCAMGEFCLQSMCKVLAPGWNRLAPLHSPGRRSVPAMAFDSARNVVVLFGGWVDNNHDPGAYRNDTWEWDGNDWRQIKTAHAIAPALGVNMAYDSARKVTVAFGGNTGGGCARLLGETWEYDGVDWTRVAPPRSPLARAFGGMAYDAGRKVVVEFGGDYCPQGGGGIVYASDTWGYDGVNWTGAMPAHLPLGRDGLSMAYDSFRRVVTLTQGLGKMGWTNDTWEYDGVDWTKANPAMQPSARMYAGFAYSPDARFSLLFGGTDAFGGWPTDTWKWDGAQWTKVMPAMSPSGRESPGMVYDSRRQHLVLFGGRANGVFYDETWVFIP